MKPDLWSWFVLYFLKLLQKLQIMLLKSTEFVR